MREITILASSDLHGYLPALPACDLLLLGGDLCPDDTPDNQAHWLNTTFRNWLEQLPAAHIVALAGNHDFVFEHRPDLILELPWHYLQDTRVELHGLHIWGTPWQPVFFNWAFNLEELELKQKWAVIPEDTDILLLHGPPHGYGDRTVRGDSTGSPSLTRRIQEIQPELVVCGHIHEARGEYRLGNSRVVNVSQLNARYEPYDSLFQTNFQIR